MQTLVDLHNTFKPPDNRERDFRRLNRFSLIISKNTRPINLSKKKLNQNLVSCLGTTMPQTITQLDTQTHRHRYATLTIYLSLNLKKIRSQSTNTYLQKYKQTHCFAYLITHAKHNKNPNQHNDELMSYHLIRQWVEVLEVGQPVIIYHTNISICNHTGYVKVCVRMFMTSTAIIMII